MSKSSIDIGGLLRKHRTRLGLTQHEMATQIGIPRTRLGSYEEGRAEPGIGDIVDFAHRLGYKTVDAFLELKHPDIQVSAKMQAYQGLPADKRKIVDFILQQS